MTDEEVDRFIVELETTLAKWQLRLDQVKAIRAERDLTRAQVTAFREGWTPSTDDSMH